MTWEPYIQTLQEELEVKPSCGMKFQLKKVNGLGEGYALRYAGRQLTVEAESSIGAFYGLTFASIAASSGHLSEYLGERRPKFSLRPLWVQGLDLASLGDPLIKARAISLRLLSLGYNSLVIDAKVNSQEALMQFVQHFRRFGLKIILRMKVGNEDWPAASDPNYCLQLERMLGKFAACLGREDFLFWEATIYSPKSERERDFLSSDLAMREVASLEKVLSGKCRLIYYIPTPDGQTAEKEAKWLPRCFLSSLPGTVFAFSSSAGTPCGGISRGHPLWEALRASKQSSRWNLLPLLNVGHVRQGEGFWPVLPLRSIDLNLAKCRSPEFLGACALASHLPKPESVLSCSLWIAGQTMLGHGSPDLLAETWARAVRPEFLDVADYREMMEDCGDLAAHVCELAQAAKKLPPGFSREEYKLLADTLLAKLRHLQFRFAKSARGSSTTPLLNDRFLLFARDAKKLIFYFLTQAQLPLVNVLNEGDAEESFWADLTNAGSFGGTAGAKVSLREVPNCGKPGSLISAIYEEVISL